jgi:hypothetical protein
VDRSISGAADFVQTNIVGVQVLLDAIKLLEEISVFFKFQLMKFMDQSKKAHGLKIGHFNLTRRIRQARQVVNF